MSFFGIVNEAYINKLCFSNCSSPNAHNFHLNEHTYDINLIEFNNSVEEYSGKSKYISLYGSDHFWYISGQSALIENSYFIYNTLKPLSYSGGIAIIKNCFFDQNYNSYISSSIGLIYFNNSINNIYQYIYLNTLLCWNFNFIFEKQSCNFYKPFKMNILIFTLNFIF